MSDDLRNRVAAAMWNSRGNGDWNDATNTALIAIYRNLADAALAEMGGVRVKPLEWEIKSERTQWARVRHVAERYIIEDRLHGPHYDLWRGFNATSAQRFDTLEAAKAAAQADYEARILAAIEPARSVREAALEKIEASLRHIESCLIFPVSTEINKRGYDTRSPTPETVEYMVDEVRTAKATLRAITQGKSNE